MEDGDNLPLSCPKCCSITPKPVRWVKENTFFTCPICAVTTLIDKDEAMRQLMEMRRGPS